MEAFFAARGYPHDLITRACLRAEEPQRADLLVTILGSDCTAPTDPHWSLHTIPRTSPSVISYCQNIQFYGMTTAPRSHFTNRRLKPSVALKNLKDPFVHSSLPQVLQRQMIRIQR